MKNFLDDDFLLNNKTSVQLYHEYAASAPIIDYHNHLPIEDICHDRNFDSITQVWMNDDHYKWRAMRANGIDESRITGSTGDKDKFHAWAATVPFTIGNPLYHWTHMELQRYFGIKKLLDQTTASDIYAQCNDFLQTREFSVRNLLRKMKVKILCTTDDPTDTLEYHKMVKEDGFEIKVYPTFRPDKVLQVENVEFFNSYIKKLEAAANANIVNLQNFYDALKSRHDFFHSLGCRSADHGLEHLYASDFTAAEIENIFKKLRESKSVTPEEAVKFKSAVLLQLAEWNYERGWVQQYHLGALRKNNSRGEAELGPDSGWDSIGDFLQAKHISVFLNKLNNKNKLAKTVLYNLNPADNAVFSTMAGNFNDGTIAGKIQWGAAWWFLDQKEGMEKHLATLANMGLVSKFIGMLTDSRSFLSFPRHEYFRRILCEFFGSRVHAGELPADIPWIGKVIQDICYNNVNNYFDWAKDN